MLLLIQGAILGLGATLLMDLWQNLILPRLPGQSPPNWALVGRWFWHLGQGQVFHDSIAAAEPHAHELTLGWTAHYLIGIAYGVAFALIVGEGWMAAPRFMPALIFGLLTIVFGWFLMHPGMGAGWAASRAPNPARTRLIGLLTHGVFALGLFGTAFLIR